MNTLSSSYSFKKVNDIDEYSSFYTCPSKCDINYNYDYEAITKYYDNILTENNNKEWIWTIDFEGFGFTHFLYSSTISIYIAKLLTEKYGHNLKKIIIINSTWNINILLTIVRPFLSEYLNNIIIINN